MIDRMGKCAPSPLSGESVVVAVSQDISTKNGRYFPVKKRSIAAFEPSVESRCLQGDDSWEGLVVR